MDATTIREACASVPPWPHHVSVDAVRLVVATAFVVVVVDLFLLVLLLLAAATTTIPSFLVLRPRRFATP